MLLSLFVILFASIAQANVFECDDHRDTKYTVEMNLKKGLIKIFYNDELEAEVKGRFVDCVIRDEEYGFVEINKICEFKPKRSRESVGTVNIIENRYGRYHMELNDRRFQGNCYAL